VPDDRLNPDEIRDLLAEVNLAIVAVHGKDGYPHSTPVWYLPEPEGTITVLIEPESVKARNLRMDRRMSILVARARPPDRWVMFRGDATVQFDPTQIEDQMLRISRRYMGDAEGAEYAASWPRPLNFIAVTILHPRVTTWKSLL
jgi:PPOX class probable F420-dependent enzyme